MQNFNNKLRGCRVHRLLFQLENYVSYDSDGKNKEPHIDDPPRTRDFHKKFGGRAIIGHGVVQVTQFKKMILVVSRIFDKPSRVPERITTETWHSAQDRFRIIVVTVSMIVWSLIFGIYISKLSRERTDKMWSIKRE